MKSKELGSGPLQHLLVFERLTEVKDESDGSVTETWLPAFKEYAEIVSEKTDYIFESQRRNALATWPQYVSSETPLFRIHHHDGIDAMTYRVVFEGKIYGIFPPMRDNRRDKMLIKTTTFNI